MTTRRELQQHIVSRIVPGHEKQFAEALAGITDPDELANAIFMHTTLSHLDARGLVYDMVLDEDQKSHCSLSCSKPRTMQ